MTPSAESIDRPVLPPLPDFRAMSLYEFNAWVVEELVRCRRQLAEVDDMRGKLAANDLNALEIVYMVAEKELNRREQGGTTPSHLHISGYVYLLATAIGYYKIGCSSKPLSRLMTFGVQLPFAVECLHTIFSVDMYGLEAELHTRFREKRAQGEWFRLSPADIEYVKGLSL